MSTSPSRPAPGSCIRGCPAVRPPGSHRWPVRLPAPARVLDHLGDAEVDHLRHAQCAVVDHQQVRRLQVAWIRPLRCACCTASRSPGTGARWRRSSCRCRAQTVTGTPSTSSMADQGQPSGVLPASWTRAMLGWSSTARACRSTGSGPARRPDRARCGSASGPPGAAPAPAARPGRPGPSALAKHAQDPVAVDVAGAGRGRRRRRPDHRRSPASSRPGRWPPRAGHPGRARVRTGACHQQTAAAAGHAVPDRSGRAPATASRTPGGRLDSSR